MSEIDSRASLPFKNLAVALLFSVFLGPVGLLYSSTVGGVIMIILGVIMVHGMLAIPIVMVWLASCVWSVVAVNRYNKLLSVKQRKE